MKLKLFVTNLEQGRRRVRTLYEIEGKECVVGRTRGSILLLDKQVSERHAMFYQSPCGKLHLKDLASKNGTHHGKDRVTEKPIRVGDEIRMGKTLLLVLEYQQTDISYEAPGNEPEARYEPGENTLLEEPVIEVRAKKA